MNEQDRQPTLWYLICSTGIGGAERRIVKVSTYFAEQGLFSRVNLVVNRALLDAYAKDLELVQMLRTSPVRVMVKEGVFEKHLFPDSLKIRGIKKIHLYLKSHPYLYRRVLHRLSWYRFLKKRLGPKDVVHCFFGDPARNACLLVSQKLPQPVIIELTSNRLVERVGSQMKTMLDNGRQISGRLCIRTVTSVVYRNLTRIVPGSFFESCGADLAAYSGPFIAMGSDCIRRPKQKVIVFAHRFIEPKNPILFCRVVRALLDTGQLDGWQIKLRGRGPLEDDMRKILHPYIDNGIVDIGFSYELGKELAESMIFVSIIITGNEPSNSVYEAMRNGNLLVLSRSGGTVGQFDHPDVAFVDIDMQSLTEGLLNATSSAEGSRFETKSEAMRRFFEHIKNHSGYVSDVRRIYEESLN